MKYLLLLFPIIVNANANASSIKTKYLIPEDATPVSCLAKNLYFEAGHEPMNGLLAIAHVTLNRVKSKEWPNSICKVVYQQRLSRKKIWIPMFSWTSDGLSDKPKNKTLYKKCLNIAKTTINNIVKDNTKKATHYHAIYANPYWAKSLNKTVKYGNHIFYR